MRVLRPLFPWPLRSGKHVDGPSKRHLRCRRPPPAATKAPSISGQTEKSHNFWGASQGVMLSPSVGPSPCTTTGWRWVLRARRALPAGSVVAAVPTDAALTATSLLSGRQWDRADLLPTPTDVSAAAPPLLKDEGLVDEAVLAIALAADAARADRTPRATWLTRALSGPSHSASAACVDSLCGLMTSGGPGHGHGPPSQRAMLLEVATVFDDAILQLHAALCESFVLPNSDVLLRAWRFALASSVAVPESATCAALAASVPASADQGAAAGSSSSSSSPALRKSLGARSHLLPAKAAALLDGADGSVALIESSSSAWLCLNDSTGLPRSRARPRSLRPTAGGGAAAFAPFHASRSFSAGTTLKRRSLTLRQLRRLSWLNYGLGHIAMQSSSNGNGAADPPQQQRSSVAEQEGEGSTGEPSVAGTTLAVCPLLDTVSNVPFLIPHIEAASSSSSSTSRDDVAALLPPPWGNIEIAPCTAGHLDVLSAAWRRRLGAAMLHGGQHRRRHNGRSSKAEGGDGGAAPSSSNGEQVASTPTAAAGYFLLRTSEAIPSGAMLALPTCVGFADPRAVEETMSDAKPHGVSGPMAAVYAYRCGVHSA